MQHGGRNPVQGADARFENLLMRHFQPSLKELCPPGGIRWATKEEKNGGAMS